MIEINLRPRTDLKLGECLEQLRLMPDNSVDSVVTDPPYGLAFMGKKWDYDVPSSEVFREILRVLKPGGHMLCACGTRTQHRMAVNIEDAGFDIRDVITWLYGSGFPKSMDISKAIDKQAGTLKLEATGETCPDMRSGNYENSQGKGRLEIMKAVPNSEASKQWQGWGTALKPACEFWTLARKPLSEKTVASNVLKHGTGGINVDGCRVEFQSEEDKAASVPGGKVNYCKGSFVSKEALSGKHLQEKREPPPGRWPANLILDEEAAEVLDEQSGELASGSRKAGVRKGMGFHGADGDGGPEIVGSNGGASRFFYVAKASKSERNKGLDDFPDVKASVGDERPSGQSMERLDGRAPAYTKNHHPTVKPIKLMTYLCRLITPPGGTVLDPFMGSGSTGVAATQEGFGFIGIEREPSYFEICKARIQGKEK